MYYKKQIAVEPKSHSRKTQRLSALLACLALPLAVPSLFEKWLVGKEGTEQAKFAEQLLALTG